MTSGDDPGVAVPAHILKWATRPGPSAVLAAARDRLESGGLGGRARLVVPLAPGERVVVGQLLGAGWAATGDAVSARALRGELLREHGVTLEDLLVALGGPLRDRRAEARESRRAAANERAAAVDDLTDLLGAVVPDEHRLAAHDALALLVLRRAPSRAGAQAVRHVVEQLSSEPGELLAALAARLFADAHALDRATALGRAVARFLSVRAAVEALAASGEDGSQLAVVDPLLTPDGWRAAWASAGVACDSVSSQVLVLNLPLVGDAAAVRQARAAAGEPTWLTLRALQGSFTLASRTVVHVCENPSVVEATADRLGAASQPLICTFGRPTTALWVLLHGIADQAQFRVRADGDSVGWSIVSSLLTAGFPHVEPWRLPPGTTQFEEELLDELVSDLADDHLANRAWINP